MFFIKQKQTITYKNLSDMGSFLKLIAGRTYFLIIFRHNYKIRGTNFFLTIEIHPSL